MERLAREHTKDQHYERAGWQSVFSRHQSLVGIVELCLVLTSQPPDVKRGSVRDADHADDGKNIRDAARIARDADCAEQAGQTETQTWWTICARARLSMGEREGPEGKYRRG